MEHVTLLRQDIIDGNILGMHSLTINNETLLFSHSGFRQAYFNYLNENKYFNQLTAYKPSSVELGPLLSEHVNTQLKDRLLKCITEQKKKAKSVMSFQCPFSEEIFQAGPDRGGDSKFNAALLYIPRSNRKVTESLCNH